MFASMEILNPIKLTVKLTSLSPHMDQLGEAGGGRYRPNFLAHPVYTVLHSTMMMEPLWKSVHFQLFSFLLSTVLWVISRIINLSSACLCSSLWEILCPPPPRPPASYSRDTAKQSSTVWAWRWKSYRREAEDGQRDHWNAEAVQKKRGSALTQKAGSSQVSVENINGKICRIQEVGQDIRGIRRVQTSSPYTMGNKQTHLDLRSGRSPGNF